MRESAPRITVLMPVWNGEAYLRESIESILRQTYAAFEFLIVDDGSTDSTPQVLADYARRDPRIRVISLPHRGIVHALNRGLEEAQSEWVARMDCDDIAHPERLSRQWQAVQGLPEAVLCHTQIEFFGDMRFVTRSARMVTTMGLTLLRLCHRCPVTHPTVMFRKAAVMAVGAYNPEERHAEDFGLWGRLIEIGDFVALEDTLLKLRVHQQSVSKQKAGGQIEISQKIALDHCRQFMRLNEDEAFRALKTLRFEESSTWILDWYWLMFHCLPRLRNQSLELWAWALRKTMLRISHSLFR